MVDLMTTAVAAFVGLVGAVVWWVLPPSTTNPIEVLKRLVAGAVAGFLWYVLFGVSPFDTTGNWDPKSILQLIVAGFASLGSLGSIVPSHFNAKSDEFKARVQ